MLKKYKANNKTNLFNLLSITRIFSALLFSKTQMNFSEQSTFLKKSYSKYFDEISKEKQPNRKLLKMIENNINFIGNQIKDSPNNFKNK